MTTLRIALLLLLATTWSSMAEASQATLGPHIRVDGLTGVAGVAGVTGVAGVADGQGPLFVAFTDEGALQMTHVVKGQRVVKWSSTPDPEKARDAGLPLLLAVLGPERPFEPNHLSLGLNPEPSITMSLHYDSTTPVFSFSILASQISSGSGPDFHIKRMYRLLCMSSPSAPHYKQE